MRQVLVSLCPHSTSRLPASCREIHDRVLGYIKMLPLLSELRASLNQQLEQELKMDMNWEWELVRDQLDWATACGKDTKTNANSDVDVNAFADTDADVDEDAVVDENVDVDVDRWRTNCREAPGRVDADSWPCMEHK
ncbi:hypothetical protein ACLKA6_003553 [Drosophila palustris]